MINKVDTPRLQKLVIYIYIYISMNKILGKMFNILTEYTTILN